jgi:hypothetical protein
MNKKVTLRLVIILCSAFYYFSKNYSAPTRSFIKLTVTTIPGSLQNRSAEIIGWRLEQSGLLFDGSSPIWASQLNQVLLDEKQALASFKLHLTVDPLCPTKYLFKILSACQEHHIPITIEFYPNSSKTEEL